MTTVSDTLPAAFRLDGRVAVVTGGGSGMGRAIAHTLAAAGAAVTVGDIDDASGADTCTSIVREGGRAQFVHADVCSRRELDQLTQAAVDTFGALHYICNLGGAPTPSVELLDVTDEQFDRAMQGHLKSVLYGCQAAVPHLLRSGGGAIVNMSSTAIDAPAPTSGLYHLAKSGVAGLTRVLANELGPQGVRVNAIAPGVTLTNFSTRHFSDANGVIDEARRAQWIEQMGNLAPLRTVGSAQDQAWLVLYLLSDAARFVTGQVVRANGGWTMG
jgi:3-oxoacyl-[acyl-carrier protein] reductase